MITPIYDGFALDYHHKRRNPWAPFIEILDQLNSLGYVFKGLIVDLGCANGRHFKIIKNNENRIIGIDNSLQFLHISLSLIKKTFELESQYPSLIQADIKRLPIREDIIDNIYSIATIHHISTNLARIKVMEEIKFIVKPKGHILISLWRKWQKRFKNYFIKDLFKRRRFCKNYYTVQNERELYEFGDILIPWTVSSQNMRYYRFYHLFSKKEARKLVRKFKLLTFKVCGGPGKKDNFFLFIENR
ncbi:MAG: class I SAM-dependent methyltransferase [Promethearchaeota archaeon]